MYLQESLANAKVSAQEP